MQLDFNSDIPIYLQLKQAIEDDIVSGIFKEESQIPSTTEISATYRINPATVLKGMALLTDEGVLYKKRGLGMFVCTGAAEQIREKRRRLFYEKYIVSLLEEAGKLGIGKEELIRLIKGEANHGQ